MVDLLGASDSSLCREAKGRPGAKPDSHIKRGILPPKPASEETERYLKVRDVARRFAVGVQTVWYWAKERPQFPRAVELSPGTTRWRMSDLIAFERGLSGDIR